MEIKIYYEDTDCGGVVYYANYLKYFERARTGFLEERGLSIAQLQAEGTLFVVIHAELTYRSPARYGDVLTIKTTVAPMRKAGILFSHVLYHRDDHRVIVEGSATLVTTDLQNKIKRLDPKLTQAILASGGTSCTSSRECYSQ